MTGVDVVMTGCATRPMAGAVPDPPEAHRARQR